MAGLMVQAARPQPVPVAVMKKFILDELYGIFHDKQAFGLIKRYGGWNKDFSPEDYAEWFTREEIENELTVAGGIQWRHFKAGSTPKAFYVFLSRQIKLRILDKSKDYGWYALQTSLRERDKYLTFLIEPNYGELVESIPKYVYHTSNYYNRDKILKKGFIPQQQGKKSKHLPRVYVALTEKAGTDFMSYMSLHGIDPIDAYEHGDYNPQILFRIDTSKLRPGTKFYYDVEVPNKTAAWTYTHIPPEAITVIDDRSPPPEEETTAKLLKGGVSVVNGRVRRCDLVRAVNIVASNTDLYHFTSYLLLYQIMEENRLKPGFDRKYLSLTTSYGYRKGVVRGGDGRQNGVYVQVCIVLDGDKLEADYILTPYEDPYYTGEDEVRVEGSISSLDKYIKKVMLFEDDWANSVDGCEDHDYIVKYLGIEDANVNDMADFVRSKQVACEVVF